MSKFFDKSDLNRKDVDNIVSETLKNCDDGELYLEEAKSESILLDDNKIKSSNYSSDIGFGFRAISNEVVAYSHSNEISKDSLKNSSANLKSTLNSSKGTYNHEIPKTNNKFYDDINPIEQKSLDEKLEVLNKVNNYLRKKDTNVKQVTASFSGEQKSIEIIRPSGEALTDESRATHPAWQYRALPQNREYPLFFNPQENTCMQFHNNLNTRLLERDNYVPKVPCLKEK